MKFKRKRIPTYLTVRACAEMAGCHHSTMRNWAVAEGVLVNRAGRDRISTERLKKAFPEIYERVVDELFENG